MASSESELAARADGVAADTVVLVEVALLGVDTGMVRVGASADCVAADTVVLVEVALLGPDTGGVD
jgi:hypothetical protein